MLSKIEKQIFEKFLDLIDKDTDLVRVSKPIDEFLNRQNISKSFRQFLGEVFEELENKRSSWQINYEDLKVLLDIMPDSMKKSLISDDFVYYKVPEAEWDKYRGREWIKEKSKALSSHRHLLAKYLSQATTVDFNEAGSRDRVEENLVLEYNVKLDRLDHLAPSGQKGTEDYESDLEDILSELNSTIKREIDTLVWNFVRTEYPGVFSGLSVDIYGPHDLYDPTMDITIQISYDPSYEMAISIQDKIKQYLEKSPNLKG